MDKSQYVKISANGFRSNTALKKFRYRLVIGKGGIGDYICQLAAIYWIESNYEHVMGEVYCPEIFLEVARNVIKKWPVYSHDEFKEDEKVLTRYPVSETITATGAHLMDLAAMYYASRSKIPSEWNYYPKLDLSGVREFELPERYCVMTPGATMETRTMPVDVFNGIVDHVVDMGIVPVFLGKRNLVPEKGYKAKIDQGYDFSRGIDLTDATGLLEAARVMRDALFVVGLDNGLLHLAAMGETPIVFGYNIASPEHRRPRRRKGAIVEVLPPKELQCRFCQSEMLFISHHFSKCLYKDIDLESSSKIKCLELMDSGLWNRAIDKLAEVEGFRA